MPYPTNASLPDSVKAGPEGMQTMWRTVYTNARETHTEEEAIKIAWAAVGRAFEKRGEEWVAKKAAASARYFLSDFADFPVDYQQVDGRFLVRGLPLCRVGKWNARNGPLTLTLENLTDYAANFAAIKEADGWTPPLRPRHTTAEEDKAGTWDTRNNLGYFQALRVDSARGALLGDVEVDAKTFELIEGGNLKYLSGELGIESSYRSPKLEKTFDRVMLGAAFIDNPAVKGMNWSLVLNAADFLPTEFPVGSGVNPWTPPPTDSARVEAIVDKYLPKKGGNPMGRLANAIKALFAAGEVQEEAVLALVAEAEPEDQTDMAAAVKAAEAKATEAQTKAAEAIAAAEKVTLEAQTQAKSARANARTTALLTARFITPAQEEPLRAVLTALDGQTRTVKLADGKDAPPEDLAETLVAMLQAKGAVDARYFRQISATAADEQKATQAVVERVAATNLPAEAG